MKSFDKISKVNLIGVLLFVYIICSTISVFAQSAFNRNDYYDFRGLHHLSAGGSNPDNFNLFIESDSDFRRFKLYIKKERLHLGGAWLVNQYRIDMNNDGTWEQGWTTSNEKTVSYYYPNPTNGISANHTIKVEIRYIETGSGQTTDRLKYIPINIFSTPRVYVNNENDSFIQLRDENCTNKIPVLMVEGFDPVNEKFQELYYNLTWDLVNTDLYPNGYEVFILNFNDGGRDLRMNADVLLKALEKIHEICPNYKIAVAGLSMGGPITRYALAKKEDQNGKHDVGLFISYDSPQDGAHSNPQLQDWIKNQDPDEGVIGILQDNLKSVAAKQMLRYNTYDTSHIYRDDFYNELKSLNGNGYPSISYNSAVSNGNFNATYGSGSVGRHLLTLKINDNLLNEVLAVQMDCATGSKLTDITMKRYGDIFTSPFLNIYYEMEILFNPSYIPTWSGLDLVNWDEDGFGNITTYEYSKFDDFIVQTVPLEHHELSSLTRNKMMNWLDLDFDFGVNYNLPEGGSVNPDNYQVNILHGIPITMQPRSINLNGNQINYNFLEWEDGSQSNPRTFYTSHDDSHTATYKGIQITNEINSHSNNSQRKIINSHFAEGLLSVYESMGKIWLERSTDDGTTWEILNNGQPINGNTEAENPSICLAHDQRRVGIVFQDNFDGYISIRMIVADINNEDFNVEYDEYIYALPISYSNISNPVITSQNFSNNGVSTLFFVTWNIPNLGGVTPGLHYLLVERISPEVYANKANGIIPNTNSNSHNPCIASNLTETTLPEFHLAWQQDGSSGVSSIKYCKISVASNYGLSFPNYSEPSAGRYSINYNPSIAITLNRPRVSWLTKHPVTLISEAVVRTYSSYWGGIRAYTYSGGDNVESVSINNRNTNYGLVMAYGGDGREIRYTKGFTTTYEASPTQNNKDVQVSNGDDFTDMFISSLKTTSSPYLFEFNQIDKSLNKASSANSSVGRSANITTNNSLFYCTIKDVVVDGEQVAFIDIPEEEKEMTTEKLMAEYLETEEFELKDKSDFTFKLSSGSTMDDETNKLLSSKNYVNFILEMVDAKDESLIETLDKINFDELNSTRTEEKSFQVNTDNIKTGNVKVRLRVEKNIDCNFTIADVISDKRELPKEGYINLDLENNKIITEYKLIQNYPNPFNPVTTISYQIPTDGFVTLKVYDVLGKEVANLVNEQKTSGRYNIQFDGSNLSSGIYFYKISVGAYTDTKKLMLMK